MSTLVTGGCGFIGLNFLIARLGRQPDAGVVNLDKLTYAANRNHAALIPARATNYHFIHGDITDRECVRAIFREHDIRTVVHFAAESHVDNSISDPAAFVDTNVCGTFELLEAAREHWTTGVYQRRAGYEGARFLHVSTDEVYGSLETDSYFTEKTPYDPSSPYSATKAASDFLVRCYFRTFGVPVVITNCSNNFGPLQHDEKLIPTVIRHALAGEPIPIYADGKNVRDWLFVGDHCAAIEHVLERGRLGESYNVGTRNEIANIDLVRRICDCLDRLRPRAAGRYRDLIAFVKDRPGHDRRYAIDPSRIEGELGFRAIGQFDEALVRTVAYYIGRYAAGAPA